jgi:hypothetical protein
MANDLTQQPWVFDTASTGDSIAGPIYVSHIIIDAGASGGTFEVSDASRGISLTGARSLLANTTETVIVDKYVDGVYMTSLADGQILVYHGQWA